jgi:hypothetical protein
MRLHGKLLQAGARLLPALLTLASVVLPGYGSCASSTAAVRHADPPGIPPPAATAPPLAVLPELDSLRTPRALPGDLVLTGDQYLPDQSSRVTAAAGSAAFDPDFAPGQPSAGQPAWAIYQFDLAGFTGNAKLQLDFAAAGASSDLWLAAGDWATQRWRFYRPGPSHSLTFTAAEFASLLEPGTGRLLCAPIALGQQDWTLDALRIVSDAPATFPNAACPLGVNLEGMADWMTSDVWVDAFKTARQWISQPADGHTWDDGRTIPVDAAGWPTSLAADQYAGTVLLTAQAGNAPSGQYVCLYDGEGQISFRLDGSIVSQAPGRIVVQIAPSPGGTTQLQITQTNPADPVRNIRLLQPGYESTYATQVFTPEFLQSVAPFKVLRFMDWMDTNGTTVTDWSTRATPQTFSQATPAGVAVEYMVDLCNREGADPWFCMGHLMTDDCVRQFATYVRDHLDPDLRVYIEHSNEVWNGGFPQAQYAQQRGLALGLSSDAYQAQLRYQALRSTQIFAIWEDVFGGTDRLVRVVGGQAVNTYATDQILGYADTAQHTDAFAIAPYFGVIVDPAAAAGVKAGGIPGIVAQWQSNIASQDADFLTAQKALADQYGVKLIAYEGGQHLVGTGEAVNDDDLTALLTSANRTPELRGLYLDYLNDWHSVSGGGVMCAFSHIGGYSKWGSWGLLEAQSEDRSAAPKWQGCMDFLAQF